MDFKEFKNNLLKNNIVSREIFDRIDKEDSIKKANSNFETFKKIEKNDTINLQETSLRGKVIIKDPETKEVLYEKNNLIMMRTRIWLFEQLFNIDKPNNYDGNSVNDRSICLFSVGSGGADINNAAFTPFSPKFSDKSLGKRVPFVIENPDKENSDNLANDPSVYKTLSSEQKNKYYVIQNNPDGSKFYYGKRFADATPENPLGSSKKWVVDTNSGAVAFSLKMTIDKDECRGEMINELGLWLGRYNQSNTFSGLELASRITFDTESLSSLTKGIEIEYIIYI